MARNQVSGTARSSKSAKMENKSRSKNKNSRNGTVNDDDGEPEVLVVPSSSSDSLPVEEKEDADEVAVEEVSENDDDNDDDDERDEVEANAASKSTKREASDSKKNKNKEKKAKEICNGATTESSSSSLYRFPMHRVNRIIKSEDPNIRISQEAVFVINKASEKFLQLFSMEAYACAFLDHKKSVAYNHLSSVVPKRRRFDFLSDFVPEKLKAEDALKEMPSVDTS